MAASGTPEEEREAPEVARHTTALLQQLRADDYRERLQAVRNLGNTGDVSVVAHLGRMLDDGSFQVRVAAVEALEEINDPGVAAWLLCALVDREPRVREAAARALESAWDRATVGPLLEAFRRKPRRARAIVRALARQGITEPLMALLDAKAAGDRDRGVIGLAVADHLQGTEVLTTALAGRSAGVRASAAAALSHVPGAMPVRPLRKLLQDEDGGVRSAAANALGEVGAPAGAALADLEERGRRDRALWTRWTCRRAARRIRDALRTAPSEPEAAEAPAGTGTEMEAGSAPAGTGTELIAEDDYDEEEPQPHERPWWRFWRR